MNELDIIGKRIARLRKAKGMTQEDLCGVAEIDRSYLSEIENGKMNLTVKSLATIARALDCRLSDLVADGDEI